MHARLAQTFDGAFIVGTGRCGSTWLTTLLQEHSNILCLSEFFATIGGPSVLRSATTGDAMTVAMMQPSDDLWGLLSCSAPIPEIRWQRYGSRDEAAPVRLITLPQLGSNSECDVAQMLTYVRSLPDAGPAFWYGSLFDWLCRRLRRETWLERSGGSLEYVAELLRIWPRAKIVHLYRDGARCALSMSRHPFFRLRVARMLRRDKALPVEAALSAEIPLDRFGAYWSAVVCAGTAHLQRLPAGQVFHLGLDALVQDPRSVLHRLGAFLGQPMQNVSTGCDETLAQGEVPLGGDALDALNRACRPGRAALRALGACT